MWQRSGEAAILQAADVAPTGTVCHGNAIDKEAKCQYDTGEAAGVRVAGSPTIINTEGNMYIIIEAGMHIGLKENQGPQLNEPQLEDEMVELISDHWGLPLNAVWAHVRLGHGMPGASPDTEGPAMALVE